MSIRRAFAWVFGLGNGREGAAIEASRSPEWRRDQRPGEVLEVHLYGEAEAIRVLYQTALLGKSPPKPPRPRRGRGVWVARYLSSLSPSLGAPASAKA
jgi:hypothetical protein